MKNARINTDLRLELSLKVGGASIDMTSIDVLSLYMYCNPQKARDGAIKHSVSTSDAKVLEMIWPADVQRYLGEHSVHGTIRYAAAVASFDIPAVNVVSKTSEADISTGTIVLEAPVGTEDLTATITIQGMGPQGDKGDKGDKGDTGATGPKGDKMTYADLTQEDKKDLYEGASEVMKPLLATKQNTLTDADGGYGQRVAELEKGKQDTLTAGNGISIEGNVIGVTAITESESQPDTSLWLNPSEDEETDVTYNRSQIDAMVGAKQDALQLTVKDNGNIVLSNIQGQSKEFMPATPSGDPMHYAYVAAGAEYNNTGADIMKDAPWADMVDDETDKTVVHKAGYWYLNGLGDLTNSNMAKIYALKFNEPFRRLQGAQVRTCMPIDINRFFPVAYTDISFFGRQSKIEIVKLSEDPDIRYDKGISFLAAAIYVKHIITGLIAERAPIDIKVPTLITVKLLRTKYSVSIPLSANLSVKSVLYMINNEEATSPITITLHADAYARAIANADIVAALQAHPNVSLASA